MNPRQEEIIFPLTTIKIKVPHVLLYLKHKRNYKANETNKKKITILFCLSNKLLVIGPQRVVF
jgi:hypothetical protein